MARARAQALHSMRDLTLSGSQGASAGSHERETRVTCGLYQDLTGGGKPRGSRQAWRLEQGEAETVVPGLGSGRREQDTGRAGSLAGQGPGPGLAGGGAHETPRLYRLSYSHQNPEASSLASAPCSLGAWHLQPHPVLGWHRPRMQGTFQKEGRELDAVPTGATRGCPPPPSSSFPLGQSQGCSPKASCRRPLVKWVVLKINQDPGTERMLNEW